MLTVIAEYPIDDILNNPDAYVPDDSTIDMFKFTTPNGPVIVSLGYDSYNCLYYFVKTYPSFTYTVRCEKHELRDMSETIIKEFDEN